MGNLCSSNQKDSDNISEKSEESPAYHIADKSKEPPLAQPESSETNGIFKANDLCKHSVPLNSTNFSADSTSESPLCLTAPVDISTLLNLPQNLTSLYGRPAVTRRIEKDKKIVLYVLSADDKYQIEKTILLRLQSYFKDKYSYKGFEIHIADLHVPGNYSKSNKFDLENWLDGPLEAQCGHHLVANCLAEITRHSTSSYIVPILFLNASLGDPLLPITIESQDFTNAVCAAEDSGKELLEKWYTLDEKSQPSCYRLNSIKVDKDNVSSIDEELNSLLLNLVDIFSKELRDSYLTTVVEQEINNTVFMSQELSKRCIWLQNTAVRAKSDDDLSAIDMEMNRRLHYIQNELKSQLSEKHIIKMPVVSQQQQDQFSSVLEVAISSEIDFIIEEHSNFHIPYCTFGVDRRLLLEIEEINRHSQILNQNCANFKIIDQIKDYLQGDSKSPLVVYGKTGSGKSVLSAKISQNIHTWIPECSFILRYANLTSLSSDMASILQTITEQLSVLLKSTPHRRKHTIDTYSAELTHLIGKSKHQVVILIDSIDKVFDIKNFDWLPKDLDNNIKIILTISNFETSPILKDLQSQINSQNLLPLLSFTKEEWKEVLTYGAQCSNSSMQIPDSWMKTEERTPFQAKILWWLAWIGKQNLESLSMMQLSESVFEILENKFGAEKVKYLLSIINASRDGLLEAEIVQLLQDKYSEEDSVTTFWTNFCWFMGPHLIHNKTIKLMDSILRKIVDKRYKDHISDAHITLFKFFEKQPDLFFDTKNKEKSFNTRKFIELPFHSFKIDPIKFKTSTYMTNLIWFQNKINATGCVQLLLDIYLLSAQPSETMLSPSATLAEHLQFLTTFLQKHFKSLNYDAQQIFSLLSTYLKQYSLEHSEIINNVIVKKWKEEVKELNIMRIERIETESNEVDEDEDEDCNKNGYDSLINTNHDENFMISLSTDREEICVWNVLQCKKVRTLNGINLGSTLVCPVGDYNLAVLCRREICVIDLNEGKNKVTLKGVMNQKMPFFGLHDSQHLVCLSRNRMYVNLMNLESGDCVTTFKAGEDRFLNSLLVSGDGRILVCGDETQKPFPLLVWHLTQRKLLYDLRIPHHDFITSLSAITHEGSYVCVVAKELAEPSPNFIVVYDLQSGTLFKKWKPSCNTVSLAISQANTCVIAGLEDARILIWDLVTGNCRCSLIGHNAPVTLLKIDPLGKVLLSGDDEGRDRSIRLWDLSTGTSLSVYTPPKQITACELTSNGENVVLALKNSPNLMTLQLKGGDYPAQESSKNQHCIYGHIEYDGNIFNLKP